MVESVDLYEHGNYHEAEVLLTTILENNPFIDEANYMLGKIRLMRGVAQNNDSLIAEAKVFLTRVADSSDLQLRAHMLLEWLHDAEIQKNSRHGGVMQH